MQEACGAWGPSGISRPNLRRGPASDRTRFVNRAAPRAAAPGSPKPGKPASLAEVVRKAQTSSSPTTSGSLLSMPALVLDHARNIASTCHADTASQTLLTMPRNADSTPTSSHEAHKGALTMSPRFRPHSRTTPASASPCHPAQASTASTLDLPRPHIIEPPTCLAQTASAVRPSPETSNEISKLSTLLGDLN